MKYTPFLSEIPELTNPTPLGIEYIKSGLVALMDDPAEMKSVIDLQAGYGNLLLQAFDPSGILVATGLDDCEAYAGVDESTRFSFRLSILTVYVKLWQVDSPVVSIGTTNNPYTLEYA